jgi:hypothetical protein
MPKKTMKRMGKSKAQTDMLEDGPPGVGLLNIKEIETAAGRYAKVRDERIALSEDEDDKKSALIDAMHAHKDELPKTETGGWSYHYGETLVTLEPSKEIIKVKSVHDDTVEVKTE